MLRIELTRMNINDKSKKLREQQQMTDMLLAASDEWRNTFDAIQDAIALLDADGKIIRCNKAMANLAGRSFSDLIGRHCWEIIHHVSGPIAGCPIETARKTLKREMLITQLGERWFEVIADPLVDANGAYAGAVHIMTDITERRQAEELLKKREFQLAESQRIAGIGSWERDLTTNTVVWSKELFRILGLDPDTTALNYQTLLDLIHPDDRDGHAKAVNEAIHENKPYNMEYRVVRPDGKTVVIHAQGEVITDGSGRPVLIRGTAQDITERKRAEQALAESEKRYRTLVESASDAIFILDLNGNFIDLNTVAYERLGYTRDEMLSKNVSEFDPPEFAARVPERIEQIKKNGRAVFESAHIRKDGSVMPVEINSRIIEFDGKKVFFSIVRDITERKQAEERIFQAKQDWEFTFNSITDMVTVHDKDYNIILANKAAEKILGLPVLEKVQGTKCFRYYHGTGAPPEGCPSCNCLKTGVPASFEVFEPHLNMFIEIRAIPRFDSSGNLIGLIHVVRDITEQKRIEKERQEYTARLEDAVAARTRELEDANRELQVINKEIELRRAEAEAASRSKSDFLANMSHELRTPLNAILGFADIIQMEIAGPVTDKQKEFLKDIIASGTHLLTLINDILDLSKIEAGKLNLELNEFDIKDLVESSLLMFKEKALKHRIRVQMHIDENIFIEADHRKLKQTLLNLLSNAFKFTPDGGNIVVRAGKIQNKTQDDSKPNVDFVEISVSDTGIGISPENQAKLFQPFQQVETSLTRNYPGTGLGLSLCRRFVELHGGRIWVESELGKGSTFTFAVPLRQRQ